MDVFEPGCTPRRFKLAGLAHWSSELLGASFSTLWIEHGGGVKKHALSDEAATSIPHCSSNSGSRSGYSAKLLDGQFCLWHEMEHEERQDSSNEPSGNGTAQASPTRNSMR